MKDEIIEINNKILRISNLDKIFWPDEGITKGDLLNYYQDISKVILPYLKDRPETLKRYPNGINGNKFYHKDVGSIAPQWVKTYRDYAQSEDKYIDYICINNLESLIFMINLAAIEMHPWSSKIRNPGKPDYIIIDLDPLGTKFSSVVKVAKAVKEVLDDLDIKGYPKTSGSKGIHIYIPLKAKYTYKQAGNFAEIVANLTHEKVKDISSIDRNPQIRKGKVYIDFLQNAEGQTVASAYSVRPLPGAPVSTPLLWEELKNDLNPLDFNIKTMPQRIKKIGDPFRDVLGEGVKIEEVIKKLEL